MKLKLLITGSHGALGRSLFQSSDARDLESAYQVIRWDCHVHGSLTNSSSVASAMRNIRPNIVLHLAWLSTNGKNYELEPANLDWAVATSSLASIAEDLGAWFIGTGSIIEECSEIASPYRESKILARDKILSTFPTATWLRPAWLLNPVEGRPRLIGEYFRSRRNHESFRVNSPATQHDFMHIADLPSALALILASRLTGVQDIGLGIPHTVLEVLESIDPSAHENIFLDDDPTASRPPEYLSNIERLTNLGWKPNETTRLFRS